MALFELNHGNVTFDPDRLEALYYNPLNRTKSSFHNFELDPDNQFYYIPDSKYFIPEQFNNILKTNISLSLLMHEALIGIYLGL